LQDHGCCNSFPAISTVAEIENAILTLSREEVASLRDFLEDIYEDQLELTDAVKAKLDEARADIREARFSEREV